jgi:hypothetical protein
VITHICVHLVGPVPRDFEGDLVHFVGLCKEYKALRARIYLGWLEREK